LRNHILLTTCSPATSVRLGQGFFLATESRLPLVSLLASQGEDPPWLSFLH